MPWSPTPDRALPVAAASAFALALLSTAGAARANPVVEFATYHGGCRGYQGIQDLAVTGDGGVVVAGHSPWDCDQGLPDAFVAGYDAAGERVFRTEFGGHLADEAKGVAIDAGGNLWVAGTTRSSRCCRPFPTADPYQPDNAGGADAFLVKLDPAGRAILYATFLGGGGDDRATDVAVDAAGRIVVAGVTASPDFPTASPTQPEHGGGEDAFVAVFDPGGSELLFATFLGGRGDDAAVRLAVDGEFVLIAGTTSSPGLPVIAPDPAGPVQPAYGGGVSDAFVARFATAGALDLLTYLGGAGRDQAHGVAGGPGGAVVLAGVTDSPDFPLARPLQPALSSPPEADAFAARIEPAGTALGWSTYLATGRPAACAAAPTTTPIPCVAVAVDAAGHAFVTAPGALAIEVGPEGERLDAAFGFGGGALEVVGAGGVLYAAGRTASPLFPTLAAADPVHRSYETEEGWLVRLRDRPNPPAGFEEDDPRIAYSGVWSRDKGEDHSGGGARRSAQPGARAAITFAGTGIVLRGRRDPAAGIVRVTLDHDPERRSVPLDLHAPEPEPRSPLVSFTGLPDRTHTLTIEVTGERNLRSTGEAFWLDGFDVIGAAAPPAE